MKKYLPLSLIYCTVFLVANFALADAATYYCGTNGDNTRTRKQARSIATPFRTIARASELAKDGDIIVALDGYVDSLQLRNPSFPARNIFAGRSYASAKPTTAKNLTIRAQNKWKATLVGEIVFENLSGIKLEGFRTEPFFDSPGDSYVGGIVFYGCSNPVVRDCYIVSERSSGISFVDCDWMLAEWNIITYQNSLSSGNLFGSSQASSAVSVFQPRYQVGPNREYGIWIRNNTVFNMLRGFSYSIDNKRTDIPTTLYDRPAMFENNLVFDSNENGRWPGRNIVVSGVNKSHVFFDGVQNVRLRNNTLARDFGFEGSPMVTINNGDRIYLYNNIISATNRTPVLELTENKDTLLFANILEGESIPADVASMNYIGSPVFDPDSFVPSATSPAFDGGFDAGDHFFLDVTGAPRLNGPLDIGAIERYNSLR
jgi:hypothetical protein